MGRSKVTDSSVQDFNNEFVKYVEADEDELDETRRLGNKNVIVAMHEVHSDGGGSATSSRISTKSNKNMDDFAGVVLIL